MPDVPGTKNRNKGTFAKTALYLVICKTGWCKTGLSEQGYGSYMVHAWCTLRLCALLPWYAGWIYIAVNDSHGYSMSLVCSWNELGMSYVQVSSSPFCTRPFWRIPIYETALSFPLEKRLRLSNEICNVHRCDLHCSDVVHWVRARMIPARGQGNCNARKHRKPQACVHPWRCIIPLLAALFSEGQHKTFNNIGYSSLGPIFWRDDESHSWEPLQMKEFWQLKEPLVPSRRPPFP